MIAQKHKPTNSTERTTLMKNRLLTFAGALAVLAILGKFYAVPLIAQVKAAIVQDRDNPARQPFNFFSVAQGAASGNQFVASATLPAVPAGKRRVIVNFFANVATTGACQIEIVNNSAAAPMVALFQAAVIVGANFGPPPGNASAASVTGLQIPVNPGDNFQMVSVCPQSQFSTEFSVIGYDIDIP
jgi:hypothetical protein